MQSHSETLTHFQKDVNGASIHVVEGGDPEKPTFLFLHGWPEDWSIYEQLMLTMSEKAHVLAIDLPGIGDSVTPPSAADKRTVAKYVHGVIGALNLKKVIIAGHDVGGQIVYPFIRDYPDDLRAAVIMNVVVPGVEPYSEVKKNPYIWHFTFHTVPDLPETLVTDRERPYFDYFYNILAGKKGKGIPEELRERFVQAYRRPDALRTGFDWYRTFAQDEKDNQAVHGQSVETPLLYLRGGDEQGDITIYVKGFQDAGFRYVQSEVIPDSGHFTAAEQPEALAEALLRFANIE